jgi:hypothetical protein
LFYFLFKKKKDASFDYISEKLLSFFQGFIKILFFDLTKKKILFFGSGENGDGGN